MRGQGTPHSQGPRQTLGQEPHLGVLAELTPTGVEGPLHPL